MDFSLLIQMHFNIGINKKYGVLVTSYHWSQATTASLLTKLTPLPTSLIVKI